MCICTRRCMFAIDSIIFNKSFDFYDSDTKIKIVLVQNVIVYLQVLTTHGATQ